MTDLTDLEQLKEFVEKHNNEKLLAEGLGSHIASILHRKFPRSIDLWSIVLASIVNNIEPNRDCTDLLVDWMMERIGWYRTRQYMAYILKIYDMLHSLKYTEDDPCIFNDLDNKTYYIPHKSKRIYIMQNQNRKKIVVIENTSIATTIHARRLWYKYDEQKKVAWRKLPTMRQFKKQDYQPKYRDFRDTGYILTWSQDKIMTPSEKVEGTKDYWFEMETFFFDINSTLCALKDIQTERLSEIHRNKNNAKETNTRR